MGALSSLEPLSHLPPFLRVVRGGWSRHAQRERLEAFTQAFTLLRWGSVVSVQTGRGQLPLVSAALDAGTVGDGVPRGVWLCLSLFLVHSFHRFRGRGGGGEAKLKFFFEKLTTSQLKDSYL